MPSRRRTSTCGVASSSRRPPAAARRCASRRTASSSAKSTSARSRPESAVEVDLVGAVDQHVGDVGQPRAAARADPRRRRHAAAPRVRRARSRRPPVGRRPAAPRRPGEASAHPGRERAARGPPRRARVEALHHAARAAGRRASARTAGRPRGRADRAATAPGRARGRSTRPGHAGRPSVRTTGAPDQPREGLVVDPCPADHEPQRARVGEPAAQAHRRGDARARVGTTVTRTWSHREAISSVSASAAARQVDDDRVVAATSGRQRLADGEGLEPPRLRPGVPAEGGDALAPRQRVTQGPGTQPAGRVAERRPTARRRPGRARAPGRHRAPAGRRRPRRTGPTRPATWPRAQAKVVAPEPPLPPTTPIVRPRAGPVSTTSVSRSTSQPSERGSSATLSAPSASADWKTWSGLGASSTTKTASRRVGAARASGSARSAPDEHQRRLEPAAQRRRHVMRHVGRGAGRGGEAEQLVEQGLVGGHEQRSGHGSTVPRRADAPWDPATGSCGARARRSGDCARSAGPRPIADTYHEDMVAP